MDYIPEILDVKKLGLDGWKGGHGEEVLVHDRYKRITTSVTQMPKDQIWTTANLRRAKDLQEKSKFYTSQGIENKTVLTFQAMSLDYLELGEIEIDDLWSRDPGRAVSFEDSGGTEVDLALSTCSYHEHLASVKGDVIGLESPNGVLVSLLVTTNDNKLVFAERGGVSLGRGQIGVIGGTYDYGQKDHVIPSPENIALDEISEELGIGKDKLSQLNLNLVSLINDSLRRPVLFYEANLPISSGEVLATFERSGEAKSEHNKLVLINNDTESILEFGRKHSSPEFHSPADAIFLLALKDKMQNKARFAVPTASVIY